MATLDNKIISLKNKLDKLDREIITEPTINGYYYSDIIYYEKAKSRGYYSFSNNLFGEEPLDQQTYNIFKKYRCKYAYKTTAIRHTAEDLNLKEKDVKRLLNKYKKKVNSNKVYKAKIFLEKNKKKVRRFKKECLRIKKHNKKILNKWHKVNEELENFINKKEKDKLNQGNDVNVVINFDDIEECKSNLKIDGSLEFFAKSVPRPVSKKDVLVAKKINKIKVKHGNLGKAIHSIYDD